MYTTSHHTFPKFFSCVHLSLHNMVCLVLLVYHKVYYSDLLMVLCFTSTGFISEFTHSNCSQEIQGTRPFLVTLGRIFNLFFNSQTILFFFFCFLHSYHYTLANYSVSSQWQKPMQISHLKFRLSENPQIGTIVDWSLSPSMFWNNVSVYICYGTPNGLHSSWRNACTRFIDY